jgi:hypothetical protein
MTSFTIFAYVIQTPSMMVLTIHIAQMTAGHLFPNLQTWENLPWVLSIIIPVINDIIRRSCLSVRNLSL